MLSTNDIAHKLNGLICPIIKGLQSYGVGKSATRDDKLMPYVDEKYIGIDDTFPAWSYHKELTVSSVYVPGFGRDQDLQNTYQMALIIYFNEKNCELTADTLYTSIQASITVVLKSKGYRSIRVNVLNAVLNDAQVWRQEYGNAPYKLSGAQRLIQINYSIVIVFDKNCIAIPNCKN